MKVLVLAVALFGVLVPNGPVHPHALEPGYLEIEPLVEGEWRITWRRPQVGGRPMGIDVQLPAGCNPRRGPLPRFDGRAFVAGWITQCRTPIWDGQVLIDGLDKTATDVLVRYTPEPGASAQTLRLTPNQTSVVLPAIPTSWSVLTSYFALGVDHILGGVDHLLFVFALMLLIRNWRLLIAAITAFTVAHSITLAAAALGWISLPMPPVEAAIALSIVFLATECLKQGDGPPTLTQTSPWIVAFAFGLLHGMGFASALREIGLPEGDIPLALVAFNLGVEAGQVLFVAVLLAAGASLRLFASRFLQRQMMIRGAPGITFVAYAIGSVAAFWTIERVATFLV